MRRTISLPLLACLFASLLPSQLAQAKPIRDDRSATPEAVIPKIFAPGVVSVPADDGSPAFSPDGKTIFFTRTKGRWEGILESHKTAEGWSQPVLAPFSGEWSDGSMGSSPDGSYLVFTSQRPIAVLATPQKKVANLWRVDRVGDGANRFGCRTRST